MTCDVPVVRLWAYLGMVGVSRITILTYINLMYMYIYIIRLLNVCVMYVYTVIYQGLFQPGSTGGEGTWFLLSACN